METTKSYDKKPFYLKPPWIVLFEPHKLQKIRPWDLSISFLLSSFLEEMEKQKEVDFRASGVALDSSATIYLLKSNLLLKLEDPPTPQKTKPDFLPPPLFYPLRYELTTTTIKHLLESLERTLKGNLEGNTISTLRQHLEPILPSSSEIVPTIDLYLMEIEKKMKELYRLLLQFVKEGKLLIFSKVISGLKKMEAIQTFITLLFLAQKREVTLWQEGDLGEIYITLMEGSSIVEKGTT